uniref:Uncharacterized protein n=1 Tax=Clastoptera arizonana TaxID=38151 RepID=A0A1B6CM58_9HEMI
MAVINFFKLYLCILIMLCATCSFPISKVRSKFKHIKRRHYGLEDKKFNFSNFPNIGKGKFTSSLAESGKNCAIPQKKNGTQGTNTTAQKSSVLQDDYFQDEDDFYTKKNVTILPKHTGTVFSTTNYTPSSRMPTADYKTFSSMSTVDYKTSISMSTKSTTVKVTWAEKKQSLTVKGVDATPPSIGKGQGVGDIISQNITQTTPSAIVTGESKFLNQNLSQTNSLDLTTEEVSKLLNHSTIQTTTSDFIETKPDSVYFAYHKSSTGTMKPFPTLFLLPTTPSTEGFLSNLSHKFHLNFTLPSFLKRTTTQTTNSYEITINLPKEVPVTSRPLVETTCYAETHVVCVPVTDNNGRQKPVTSHDKNTTNWLERFYPKHKHKESNKTGQGSHDSLPLCSTTKSVVTTQSVMTTQSVVTTVTTPVPTVEDACGTPNNTLSIEEENEMEKYITEAQKLLQ